MTILYLNTQEVRTYLQAEAMFEFAWCICPVCCWVSRTPVQAWRTGSGDRPQGKLTSPTCPRPVDEIYGATALTHKWAHDRASRLKQTCKWAVWLADIAPRVADSLEAALKLGGTNACIQILTSLSPIEIGLDDPGGAVPARLTSQLEDLRPLSVSKPKWPHEQPTPAGREATQQLDAAIAARRGRGRKRPR